MAIDLYGRHQASGNADVLCVFGAAVWGDVPSPELASRINWAVALLKEGRAEVLFLSGGPTGGALNETDVMASVALAQGVRPSQLILDSRGTNTTATLRNLSRYMQGNDMKTAIVVSSPFHMARISLLAKQLHMRVLSCPPAQTPVMRDCGSRFRATLRELLAIPKDVLLSHWART